MIDINESLTLYVTANDYLEDKESIQEALKKMMDQVNEYDSEKDNAERICNISARLKLLGKFMTAKKISKNPTELLPIIDVMLEQIERLRVIAKGEENNGNEN